jgi:hypothetical protein
MEKSRLFHKGEAIIALARPGIGVGFDGLVIGVEGRFEEENGGDAASHFLNVADFIIGKRAAEERQFAVREPLLDDLIATDGVVPDFFGDVGPESVLIELVVGLVYEKSESYFFG